MFSLNIFFELNLPCTIDKIHYQFLLKVEEIVFDAATFMQLSPLPIFNTHQKAACPVLIRGRGGVGLLERPFSKLRLA